jgi:uncharacterized surface protein with fasciclin (FAS1) repeats
MRHIIGLSLAAVLMAAVMLCGCAKEEAPLPQQVSDQGRGEPAMGRPPGRREIGEEPKDIVDTAVAAGGFTTLAAALEAADLVDTLKGPGPFTVFAPTDEAFGKLPAGTLDNLLKPESKEQLGSVLTYHVVPGKYMAEDVANMDAAPTVNGKELSLKVEEGVVMVDGAKVVQADIEASNGVIHVIDAVLLP